MKGTDQGNVEVAEDEQNYDEIKSYINMRCVSSCEAVWRINEYKICELKPSVMILQVHMENENQVYYRPNTEDAKLALERQSITRLTEYFEANKLLPGATETLYKDFPQNFDWRGKKWKVRTKNAPPANWKND